jgi:major membrane immunogen (membrane-anchored lipoprotein)
LSWLPAFSITNPPVKYEVQVSTDKSFSNIVVDHTGTSFTDISSSLSDGVYYIRVQATDTLGGQSSWSSFNKFTVDTTNPVVSITSPANGKSVKGSVPVTGTFTDLNPAGYTWTITNSANHIVELKTFSGSSVAPLSLSKLADGTYTVTLEGFDLAGNHSSDSITINVDNTAPTISVDTLPLTSDNTPTITGKTDDPTAIITFTLNSDPTIYTATNNGDGTWSYTMPTVLSDGVYDISATATDPADNVGTATGSITVDAHQPGAPTLFTPSNNSYTNDNTPFINWKASSKTTNNPVTYTVEISSNSSFGSPTITSGLTTSSYTPASLSDGPYYVRVDTTDNLGAISGWSNVHEFTVDTINPVVKITSPHNYSHVKGSVEVNGTFSDLNPDHYSWTITKSGHKGDIYHHDFSGTTVAPLSLSKLADGTYTVTLEGFDLAGNHSSDSITITVDNTAPTASFTFPTTLGPTATSFTVQFDEAVKANEASNPANYFLNNWPGAQSFSSLAGNATVTYNNLTHVATVTFTNPGWYVSGEQQWGVKNIYDLAGNLINTNPTTAYSSPLTDPGLPGSPTTTTPTNNDSVTWTWTAATDLGVNPSGVKGYIYELLDSSSSVVVPYSTTPSSALSATTTVVADGTYTLNVEAVDNAGNVGPASTGTVIVDTVPPTLTINPSTSSTNTNPTITGTTSDSTDVVTVDGQLATVSTTPNLDGSFTWTYTLPTQTVGTHIVTVISTDLAGNAAQETANVVVSPIVTPSVALTTNGGGTTGNTNPGNTVTITPTGTVLGDSTTTPNGGNVKGDNTVNTDIKNTSNTKNSNFLGLGWWWLLVLAAVLGFGWFLFGRRKSDQDEA